MIKRPPHKKLFFKLNQNGFTHGTFLVIVFIIFGALLAVRINGHHVSADSPRVTSGIKGYCLTADSDSIVVNGKCNETTSQTLNYTSANITHGTDSCLSVENNDTAENSPVNLSKCDNEPGQIWLRDQSGFYNPNSMSCLSSENSSIVLGNCDNITKPNDIWNINSSSYKNSQCNYNERLAIACNAEKEWTNWQAGNSNHEALLNTYTDGTPYEEWCADFVSYIYKESGHPFTQGEADGWDENNANNIQNMGFTQHYANTGYIPKTGDVAYFNYNGGHVEIVVSGGSKPTFVYGNSATIDPTTGNGEMEANTETSDGSLGQLVYYLSPN